MQRKGQNRMPRYKKLSKEIEERILKDRSEGYVNPMRYNEEHTLRRDMSKDKATLTRSACVRDIEKIMHLPLYNRYADKTQVFSFYLNDDITRRGLHVQIVSRVARNIGSLLGLNNDLIEAIALGHDIGHTPFGHAGERFLSELLHKETGYRFNHNVHSVRVLDRIFGRNLALATLDGILCHNGEIEKCALIPAKRDTFEKFDADVYACYTEGAAAVARLIPSTLEGCVVRMADLIAYLGKDRQDARRIHMLGEDVRFSGGVMGSSNAEIINNLTVDIVENSYGKNGIFMSEDMFAALSEAKKDNYALIYKDSKVNAEYESDIKPMMADMFARLCEEAESGREDTFFYKYHMSYVLAETRYYENGEYEKDNPAMLAADFIAAMTDDYFIELYHKMFPENGHRIQHRSYFAE